jgi:peptide/nickel transport system permease protein
MTSTIDLARESTAETEVAGIEARTPLELFWRRLRDDRVAIVSLGFIVFLVLCAVAAPLIIKLVGARPPNDQSTKFLDSFGTPKGPSSHNVFGADPLGRDVFSRVLYGARVSLEVAIIATALSVFIGVVAGMFAGYYRGWVDTVISRAIDVLLAFPILLLALGLASACSLGHGCLGGLIKPGLTVVIFVIAFVNWTYIARIIRGQVLSLREKEFVEAARSLGASNMRIVFREILPNLVAPIIVYSTLIIPQNILFEAALSFLGVGVQPPNASWGAMLADATDIFDTAWWYMVFPGAALLLTVLAFNLLGDGLQDALNPKSGRNA